MKEAKRTQITQPVCDDVKQMLEAGMKQKDIGRILKIDPSTVSKIKRGNYDLEAYLQIRKESNGSQREKKKMQEQQEKPEAEEPIAGQIEMELTTEKPDMSEQTKMMRFWGAQFVKIEKALNQINETLKEIRKE